MLEDVTIGQIIVLLSAFFLFYELICKVVNLFNSPAKAVDDRLTKFEIEVNKKLVELENKKVDNTEHDKLQNEIKLLLKVNYALLEHSITGNHTDQMVQLKDDLNSFIINELG